MQYTWLNDELPVKVNCIIEIRKTHSDVVADMGAKIALCRCIYAFYNINFLTNITAKLSTANEKHFTAKLSTVCSLNIFIGGKILEINSWPFFWLYLG